MRELRRGGTEEAFATLLHLAGGPLADRILDARPASRLHGWGGHPGYLRQAHGPGWALVGDAGYFKDPITTHGMTDALRDAQLLADAVVAASSGQTHERVAMARYQSDPRPPLTAAARGHRGRRGLRLGHPDHPAPAARGQRVDERRARPPQRPASHGACCGGAVVIAADIRDLDVGSVAATARGPAGGRRGCRDERSGEAARRLRGRPRRRARRCRRLGTPPGRAARGAPRPQPRPPPAPRAGRRRPVARVCRGRWPGRGCTRRPTSPDAPSTTPAPSSCATSWCRCTRVATTSRWTSSEFARAADQALQTGDQTLAAEALHRYAGPLLPEDPYEPWTDERASPRDAAAPGPPAAAGSVGGGAGRGAGRRAGAPRPGPQPRRRG